MYPEQRRKHESTVIAIGLLVLGVLAWFFVHPGLGIPMVIGGVIGLLVGVFDFELPRIRKD